MEFAEFKTIFQQHFEKMICDASHLFEVDVDKDELWNLYLDSFPAGTNEVYRQRREFDCSCCRSFIKSFGNVVVIKDSKVETLWDFETGDDTFQPVVNALSAYIKARSVTDVYVTKFDRIGTDRSREIDATTGAVTTWEHFYVQLPRQFVYRGGDTLGGAKGTLRDTRNVLERSLREITPDSVATVLELISQNSLYKGEEWAQPLRAFQSLKSAYDALHSEEEKENYCWEQSVKVGAAIGRIRNHSIGTLLTNISEGMELDTAVTKYEAIVAPSNYKRPKAIFTQKMLDDAKETLRQLGYMDSLARRFATLDDITVNNILYSNRDAARRIEGADVFAEMSKDVAANPRKFSKVEEVPISVFVKDILPTAKDVQAYLENRHVGNMVSLIAPSIPGSKTMFKWDNGFSWAYAGNMTDSMKERVKAAGGKVDGVLRFSIQWNDSGDWDNNDVDAHCIEPRRNEIFYAEPENLRTTGQLDVDIRSTLKGVPAVENITWHRKERMDEGKYLFFVHCYAGRGGKSGFRAQIEYDGQIFAFDYSTALRHGERVNVAEVTLKNGVFTIKELLPSNVSSREVWNLSTSRFVPVSVVMYSPNYWDEQDGIGHRHYFFMLKDCINPERPNPFYNEFLRQELDKHKRVFEALGSKMAVAAVEDQLSGIGFSSTKRDELVVKVSGAAERIIKIKF